MIRDQSPPVLQSWHDVMSSVQQLNAHIARVSGLRACARSTLWRSSDSRALPRQMHEAMSAATQRLRGVFSPQQEAGLYLWLADNAVMAQARAPPRARRAQPTVAADAACGARACR